MTPRRIPYLVLFTKADARWSVRRSGVPIGACRTRDAAHAYACRKARGEWRRHGRTTEVRLKNRGNGRFSEDAERTYGRDPHPPKG